MAKNNLKQLWFILCLLHTPVHAQWLPPVNFPGATNVCDSTPWKLVFYDEFDGTTLNSAKWVKFNHWNGFESDDWQEGRIPYPGNHTVIQDENVVVSDGTVKLKVKQETTTWQCATCTMTPYTKNYTSGYISTRYSNAFNSGRIEARLKMPLFKGSWGTCWTWGTRVNEIDFAESRGGGGSIGHSWPYIGDRPRNTYNLHAWAPDPNPLSLPELASIRNVYPNQSWWNWFTKNHHYHQDWHTYVCEWDTAFIKIYLDGSLINTIWKYYRKQTTSYFNGSNWVDYLVKVPSGCNLGEGTWNITEGYPYSNNSESKIVFSVGMTNPNKVLSNDGELGQMEIDYVKVYQRHPELENRTEICNYMIPTIIGPTTLCGPATYTISPATSNGIWTTNNGAVIIEDDPNGESRVLVSNNPNSPHSSTILSYTYTPSGCPPVTISKTIHTGKIDANILVSRNWYCSKQDFNLWVSSVIPGATYNWKIWYGSTGIDLNLNYHTSTGPYITTPKITHYGTLPYYLKWELIITTSCGKQTLTGVKNNMSYLAPIMTKPETFMEPDSSVFYLETRFTNDDSIHYEQIVRDIIATTFVENTDDTTAIAGVIGKIRMDALEQYLHFENDKPDSAILSINSNNPDIGLPKLFPTPLSENFPIERIKFVKE